MFSFIIDIVFTTAHKSKGLEFDTVVLTDDFLTVDDLRERKSRILYAKALDYNLRHDSIEGFDDIDVGKK